jgi:alpha-galactosidase
VDKVDSYAVRTAFAPCLVTGYDMTRRDHDYALLRRLLAEWRQLAQYYYADFYPLTPYSRDEGQWMAWQFNRPDKGDGMVQVFRRPKCPAAARSLPLRGLDASAKYEVSVLGETGKAAPAKMTGRNLMASGLPVRTTQASQALTVFYRRAT